MSVLMTDNKKELIVNCKCGCDAGFHIRVDDSDKDYDYYAIMSYTNGNFYTEQYGMFSVMCKKAKKIWAIIRNKDFYYSDVAMSKADFKVFKDYINQFGEE